MVLALAGKIKQNEAKRLAEKYFGQTKKKGKKLTKAIKSDQKTPRTRLVYKKTEQTHFWLGVPAYPFSHPDRFVISILIAILGVGLSSRLFTQIRERRGLAYYVSSASQLFTDSGFLAARAGVKTEKTEEAIQVCRDEFFKIATQGVDQKELNKAKEIIKGSLILNLEDSKNVANRYLFQTLLEGKIRTVEQTIALIDKVTSQDTQRVAKDIFKPEKMNLAIIGPYKNKARFRKLLS